GTNSAGVMRARGADGGRPRAPYAAGVEAAGESVGIGAEVAHPLPLGSHVVGTGPGAFAQYMTAPAAQVLPVPSGWTDAEALGMVLNWATALAALKPPGELEARPAVPRHPAA